MSGIIIKSTWTRVTRKDILTEFWALVQRAQELHLFSYLTKDYECIGLYQSDRRTRNVGTCYTNNFFQEWLVVINDKILQCSIDKIRKILVHEIAHACVPKDHHGPNWHTIANILGAPWGYEATRLQFDDEIINACNANKATRKYIVECPLCHVQWKYKIKCRTIKYPELYHHTKCGTNLVRIDDLD